MTPSPNFLATWSPISVTAAKAASKYAPTRSRQSSALSSAEMLVEPTSSQNMTGNVPALAGGVGLG